MNKVIKLIFAIVIFYSHNFTANSIEVEFETMQDALNYSGNAYDVTSIVIKGKIEGNDYSTTSEWSKFYNLNDFFPYLENVEILTEQNIPPDGTSVSNSLHRRLFSITETNNSVSTIKGADWLKIFSAPNVKNVLNSSFYRCGNITQINFASATSIGTNAFGLCANLKNANFPSAINIDANAFDGCSDLINIDFPSVINIGESAFNRCSTITQINFPSVVNIGANAFMNCINLENIDFPSVVNIGRFAFTDASGQKYPTNLTSASFGTAHISTTTINFADQVFGTSGSATKNADLIIGIYVLPRKFENDNTWQKIRSNSDMKYIWNSITVGILEDNIYDIIITPNPTENDFNIIFNNTENQHISIELIDFEGKKILDIFGGIAPAQQLIYNINQKLVAGMYLIKFTIKDKIITKKVIVN